MPRRTHTRPSATPCVPTTKTRSSSSTLHAKAWARIEDQGVYYSLALATRDRIGHTAMDGNSGQAARRALDQSPPIFKLPCVAQSDRTHLNCAVNTDGLGTCRGHQACQSGREDLNLRPSGPEPDALPSCATPRMHSDSTPTSACGLACFGIAGHLLQIIAFALLSRRFRRSRPRTSAPDSRRVSCGQPSSDQNPRSTLLKLLPIQCPHALHGHRAIQGHQGCR